MKIDPQTRLHSTSQTRISKFSKWFGRTFRLIFRLSPISDLFVKTIKKAIAIRSSCADNVISQNIFLKQIQSGEKNYTEEKSRKQLISLLEISSTRTDKYKKECIKAVESMFCQVAEADCDSKESKKITKAEMADFALMYQYVAQITRDSLSSEKSSSMPKVFELTITNACKNFGLVDISFPSTLTLWKIFTPFKTSSILELMAAPTIFQYIRDIPQNEDILAEIGFAKGSPLGADTLTPLNYLALLTVYKGELEDLSEKTPIMKFYSRLFQYILDNLDNSNQEYMTSLGKYQILSLVSDDILQKNHESNK